MTDTHPNEPRGPRPAPASTPSAASPASKGGQIGNDNARGHRNPANAPSSAPLWHQRARRALANDYALGRFRGWGGTATAPNLYGATVTTPDPRKARIPNPARPFLASYGGVQTWHGSPASARAEIEAERVRQQNAERDARLAEDPFSDPVRRAALARALRALRGF